MGEGLTVVVDQIALRRPEQAAMDIGLAVSNQVQRGLPVHQLELDRTTGNPAIFAPQIDQQAIGLTLFIEVGEGLPGLGVGHDERLDGRIRQHGPRLCQEQQPHPAPDPPPKTRIARHPCTNLAVWPSVRPSIIATFSIEEQA